MMVNREKVIKGLECCVKYFGECKSCPYGNGFCNCDCGKQLYADAIALLKEQEPVCPTEPDEDNMKYCGACGSPVGYEVLETPGIEYVQYCYCPNCGRAVKWNG